MDQLLLTYVQATDESERQEKLDDLVAVYASPTVRWTLRQKLGFYVNQIGLNPHNPDAEDLYHEIIAKVLELLTALPTTRTDIENFESYVGRIAANACLDHIRTKSPTRTRLKYSMRELLSRKSEFIIWKSEEDFLCGLKEWNMNHAPVSSQRLDEIESELAIFRATRFGGEDINQVALTTVTAELLAWIGEPIELDQLVNLTAILLDVKDRPAESLDDEEKANLEARFADTALVTNPGLDQEKLLRTLWKAILSLPKNLRDAFCFRFMDDDGEDLFTLLFEAEIITRKELAVKLGRSLDDLMRIWSAMPMSYDDIATELKATKLQVRRWRFDAVRKLEKHEDLRRFLGRK